MDDTPERTISEAHRKVQEIGSEASFLHSLYRVIRMMKQNIQIVGAIPKETPKRLMVMAHSLRKTEHQTQGLN